jgi:hypothetical protein
MNYSRYALKKLHSKYKKTPIPWNILNLEDDLKEKSMPLFYEIIISKLYYAIIIAADYPEQEHNSKIYKRTETLLTKNNIDIGSFSDLEKIQHAQVAAFKLITRYLNRRKRSNIVNFVSVGLPLYYSRELMMADIDYTIEPEEVELTFEELEEQYDELPITPEEYIKYIYKSNTADYARRYSFYPRTHIYRILKRLSPSTEV